LYFHYLYDIGRTPKINVKWPILMSQHWTTKSTLDIFTTIYFKA
jgi:hypothetical protein